MAIAVLPWCETPQIIVCDNLRLIGVCCAPRDTPPMPVGVLFIVGGPQYRVGSHRQLTLLARQFAVAGVASLRFDYRGMGDGEGNLRNFESVEMDIHAAVQHFLTHIPAIRTVALWGLCDAAAAILNYAHTDRRISHLILLNPWVHNPQTEARVRLRRYYPSRLLAWEFWLKVMRFQLNTTEITRDIWRFVKNGWRWQRTAMTHPPDFVTRMLIGLERFRGCVLLILSHRDDLTVAEFLALLTTDQRWQRAVQQPNVTWHNMESANHTFSRLEWREQVGDVVVTWMVVTASFNNLN